MTAIMQCSSRVYCKKTSRRRLASPASHHLGSSRAPRISLPAGDLGSGSLLTMTAAGTCKMRCVWFFNFIRG